MKRLVPFSVAVGMVLALTAAMALAQSASLKMTARPGRAVLGEPVTFTITKTNMLPSDLAWSVRDILPESVEFISATYSQGTCALLPHGSNIVRCDLGTILSGESVTMDITVIPTIPGKQRTTWPTGARAWLRRALWWRPSSRTPEPHCVRPSRDTRSESRVQFLRRAWKIR